jgi:hypothetical protein
MKAKRWFGLLAAVALPLISSNSQVPPASGLQTSDSLGQGQNPGSAPVDISPSAAEVVKLAESGSSDDVLIAYIGNSKSTYNLSADAVIYLKDVGLSGPVVTAMLTHDSAVQGSAAAFTYDQKAYPASGQPPIPQAAPPPTIPEQPAPVEAAPPAYVADPPPQVNYFYNDLAPYGSWVQLEGYGWCWQPRTVVVDRGWQPYCNSGHWVYTDAGWFWQSDYSWGWQRHERCGWVWLPDTVWAPAWVTWRVSGDNCGWAPLPAHADFDARLGFRFNGVSVRADFDFGLRADNFTFIALKDFNDRDLGHRRLSATEARNVYGKTTIVNSYTVNNNVIVNHGIAVERVTAVTHTDFKKVAIRDVPRNPGKPAFATPGGKREAVVFRPELKAPVKPANMVAQRVDNQHPVIQHAAIAPPRTQRIMAPGNGSGNPAHNPTRTQSQPPTQAPNHPQPSGGEKPPFSASTHPAPETHASPQQNNIQKQQEPAPQRNQIQNTHPYYPARYPQPHAPSQNQNQSPQPSRPDNGSSPQSRRDGQ